MTHVADVQRMGWLPGRHDDDSIDERLLLLPQVARVVDGPRGEKNLDGRGPYLTMLLWDSVDQPTKTRFWSSGAAAVVTDGGIVPVEGPSWSDLRDGMVPSPAALPLNQRLPGGWPVAVFRAAFGAQQREVALPGFLGLVAPHFDGTADLGTAVYDCDGNGLSIKRRARLQSLMRTWLIPKNGCLPYGQPDQTAALALQLGIARDGYAGHGATADIPPGGAATVAKGSPPPEVIALLTYRHGGPLHCGGAGDVHDDGVTADGEKIRCQHLDEDAKWFGQHGDSPMEFRGAYPEPKRPPFPVDCGLYNDIASTHPYCGKNINGLRRWVAWCYFSRIEPPDPPPISDPFPPVGDPFPPPEGEPKGPRGPKIPPQDGDGRYEPKPEFDTPLPGLGELEGGFANPFGPGAKVYSRISSDHRMRRPLNGSAQEMAFPGIAFRPQYFEAGALDLRSIADGSEWTPEHAAQWAAAPVVMRMSAVGRQLGGGDFARTQERGTGQYPDAGGTANGAVWDHPAEVDISMLLAMTEAQITASIPSISAFYRGIWRGRSAFGTPLIGQGTYAGGVASGFSTGLFSSTQLNTDYHDATGARTVVTTLTSAGVFGAVGFVSSGESIFDTLSYESVLNMRVKNATAGTLTAPLVVKATGYDTGDGVPTVSALTSFRDVPLGILLTDLATATVGSVARNGATIISGLNTAASYIGAPVFASAAGVLSLSAGSRRVGFVLDLAATGRIMVDIAAHNEIKTETMTANFNAVGEVSYDVDTTGGAVTVTLPAITQLMDGTKIIVTDTGNAAVNNITVARSSTDTIKGGTTLVYIAAYASATYIAKYVAAGVSVWQVT